MFKSDTKQNPLLMAREAMAGLVAQASNWLPTDPQDGEPVDLVFTDRNPEEPGAIELERRQTKVTFFQITQYGAGITYSPIPADANYVSLAYGSEFLFGEKLTPLSRVQLSLPGVARRIGPFSVSFC